MKPKSAESPESEEGLQYHLRVKPGDVSRYVLLPGDPERVKRIASFWDEAWHVSSHREFTTYTGRYRGVLISSTSTGIGAPSTAIAVEELLRVGADTFIRVGTTSSLHKWIRAGDIVISTGAVRLEGTSKLYVMPEYPALASYEVVLALIEAAEGIGARYHVGLSASSDSFYVGQERPGFRDYIPPALRGFIDHLRRVNVLNFEMEASLLFTLSNLYGFRAGMVCAAIANRDTGEFIPDAGIDEAIRVANEAVKVINEWDLVKEKKGRKNVYPSLLKEWLAGGGK